MLNRHCFIRKTLQLALIFLTLKVVAFSANAADDAGTSIRAGIDEALSVAYSKPGVAPTSAQLRPHLAKSIAFDLVTRQAMGPGWKQFSAADQARVTDLFTELMIRTYSRQVIGTKRPKIVYGTPVVISATREELPSQVTTSLTPEAFPVIYRIAKLPQGWRIYDIVIEGVSFVANYREQFNDMIQKGGAPAVIHSLEAKLSNNS